MLVVVDMVPQRPLFSGRPRLGSVQCLNLIFLIHTQHDGLLELVQIQPDHVPHFLQELRIARQPECLYKMRLQIVGLPDIV